MSQAMYTKLWRETQVKLNRVLHVERPKKEKPLPIERESCFQELGARYVQYCMIYRSLQECYDHIVHPQKYILIAKLLEAVTGRVVEMRRELERLAISEYINLVDVCFDKKVQVEEIELSLSGVQTINRMTIIHQRVILLDYILQSIAHEGDSGSASSALCTKEEAILLIQRNQRGFVGRRKEKWNRKRILARKKMSQFGSQPGHTLHDRMVKIQSLWRGYQVRRKMSEMRQEVAESIGMRVPESSNLEVQEKMILFKDYNKNEDGRNEYMRDLIIKTEEYKDTDSWKIETSLAREIRQWILEYRDLMGTFPQFPTEDEGGSLALYSDMSLAQLEDDLDELQEEMLSGNKKDAKAKDKDKKDKDKKKGKGDNLSEFAMMPSKFVDSDLVPSCEEYCSYWLNKDERKNPQQGHDHVLMMEEIHRDVEGVIRKQVDILIRAELEHLERGISKIPTPIVKPKKEKPPKEKKKKGKGKDLTEGVPLEELYKELVLAGVIKKVATVNLKDFVGEVNLMCPRDSENMEFQHDLGDVRKMIFDYAILPLSSAKVHEKAPFNKSLMLVGPHGSGKKMLVDAICTELGANLFDLSPENINGLYEDKDSQKRFMQLLMKVAKQMEPSIIHIGNCDRMFTKKLPPDDNTKPGRLKNDMKKALKSIGPSDRILLIGTSKLPFKASVGQLFKMYERVIFIYPPSSKSRNALWNKFITDRKGIMAWPQFQMTPLAQVSKGYTAGDIKNATIEVLGENRIKRQQRYPLTLKEFVTRLATFDPVYVEEQEAFDKWLEKTPLRKRLATVKELEEGELPYLGML